MFPFDKIIRGIGQSFSHCERALDPNLHFSIDTIKTSVCSLSKRMRYLLDK